MTKLGRKTILQTGTFIFIISLLMVAIGFFVQNPDDEKVSTATSVLVMGGLIIFMADFGLSLGPIVWLYIPEIVEPQIIPFTTLSNWAAAAVVMFLYPILSNSLGSGPVFLFFGLWCLISFFINQKYVIETKGKIQKEIFE